MAWNFELVSGPFKGRTGGLAWDGSGMLFSAVGEERIMRFDPKAGKTDQFRWWTGRANGIAVASDGTVFGAQEAGRRVVHYLNDGTAVQTQDLLDGAHHNQPVDVQALDCDFRGVCCIYQGFRAAFPGAQHSFGSVV